MCQDIILKAISSSSLSRNIRKLKCLDEITIHRIGSIEELKQQDYLGKRVYVEISDRAGNKITSKLDLGVHNRLSIEQEDYCFDIAFDEEGASLLINSNEQMFTEKLRSLLRFGAISTRYKDIFDMYFLCQSIEQDRLETCLHVYIYDDPKMRENSIDGVIRRVRMVFRDRSYLRRLQTTEKMA